MTFPTTTINPVNVAADAVHTRLGPATYVNSDGIIQTSHSRVFARTGNATHTDADDVLQPSVTVADADFPGASGDYVSTPDSAALSITGDIDIRVKVALDDWTPSSIEAIGGKWYGATERTWRAYININGTITFQWSSDGAAPGLVNESAGNPGFTNGVAGWLRFTLDVDDGAGGYEFTSYKSSDGVTWTGMASNTGGSTTSMFDSDREVELGSVDSGLTYLATGKVYAAQIRDGIYGTLVADVDFTDADGYSPDLSTYTDPQGNVWTFQGNCVPTATQVLRDSHYQSDGTRTLKLEGAATNEIPYSQEFDNAAWSDYNTITTTANDAIAPDGTTTADKLDDTDGTNTSGRMEDVTVADDSTTWCASVYVKKRTGGQVASLVLNYRDGSSIAKTVNIDPSDGTVGTNDGATSYGAVDGGDHWRVWIALANNGTGNVTLRMRVHPAVGSDVNGFDGTDTGYNHFWGAQLENTAFPTSYIPTAGSAVTRNADSCYFDYPHLPQAMTVYCKFVERGSVTAATDYMLLLGADSGAHIRLAAQADDYVVVYNDGASNAIVNSAGGSSATIGGVNEFRVVLQSDAELSVGLSVDSGAETVESSTGSGTSIAAAWAAEKLYVAQKQDGTKNGFADFIDLKVAAGVQTMATMRTAEPNDLQFSYQPGDDYLRDGHYQSDGTRSIRLEGAATNLCEDSEDFSQWTLNGTPSRTGGQADPAGGTSAYVLGDTDAGAVEALYSTFTTTQTGSLTFSVYLKQGTESVNMIGLYDTGGSWLHRVKVTWTAGVPALTTQTGSGSLLDAVAAGGGWYRVAATCTVVAARAHRTYVYPTDLINADVGTVYAFGAQVEESAFPTSYIPTSGASAPRAADSLYLPWTEVPQAMTVYCKFVERGTSLVNDQALYWLGTADGAGPYIRNRASGGFYLPRHDNGSGLNAGAVAAGSLGDETEIRHMIFADGSHQIGLSVNGAAETLGTASAAHALASAWADPVFFINSIAGAGVGFADFEVIALASGVQSMEYMRGAASGGVGVMSSRIHMAMDLGL